MASRDNWQIQDAKQRFSEMIRAVAHDGPQIITRHGEEVAVVVDIAEYRRLTRPTVDLTGLLLGEPALSDDAAELLAEVEAERKATSDARLTWGSACDLSARYQYSVGDA